MKPITIILTDGYSDWEIAPLAGAGRAFFGADIRFASPRGGAVTSVAGLPISDTIALTPPDDGVVVVCGGSAWEGATAPDISDALRQSLEKGCVVAAICGGTVALANAGLLDQVRHTSNGADYLPGLSKAYRGTSNYVDQPQALRDGQIITAPAPAPASFAFEVLAAAGLPEDAARQIKDMLGQEHQR
ncbi:DJ-1/PfpI family protein [Devosia rhizoryzae]|uniref:DJ-1/PfpI family protein n=1 Tax=Devosia rhizoryzae TaxID=2774137 RepID=A0ABX7C6U1_9HYPH|nr:DJ-1/PfpI family protein [Devosia rhizoryzae]QQR38969.1 DJ-1/PfpI family protein [Devosia rhizoryzae]